MFFSVIMFEGRLCADSSEREDRRCVPQGFTEECVAVSRNKNSANRVQIKIYCRVSAAEAVDFSVLGLPEVGSSSADGGFPGCSALKLQQAVDGKDAVLVQQQLQGFGSVFATDAKLFGNG